MAVSSKNRRAVLAGSLGLALTAGLAGLYADPQGKTDTRNVAARVEDNRVVPTNAPIQSFAPLVKRTVPAVVNINSSRVVRAGEGRGRGNNRTAPREFPFDFFGFGDMQPPQGDRRESGEGSGVIVSADGHILTNNHVVADATEVTVTLNDRREFRAKIVGTDPRTDLAVLKVDARDLPTLPLGDSSTAQVGDLALAIGNPFGLGQSVTMGIIGGTGRSGLNPENFEDFIQTDAAINPGNSGGALINTRGELIGINTAIFTRSGGNQGIGFAVPANMARSVMDQIIKSGKVTRGWMGVGIQEVTPALARGLGMKETRGVAISSVEPNSPASRAGIQRGDVVIEMAGAPVVDLNTFRLRVSSTAPGQVVPLKVFRDGREQNLSITLGESGRETAAAGRPDAGGAGAATLEGVEVESLTADLARELQLPASARGVVVTSVSQASEAFAAGVRRGDVIEEVQRKPVVSVREFEQAIRAAGTNVLLTVNRGGRTIFVAIEPVP